MPDIKAKKLKKSSIFRRILCNRQSAGSLMFEYLITDILNANKIMDEPGLTVYRLGDDTQVEFYKKGSYPPEGIFDQGYLVMSFKVPDINMAAQQFIAGGALLLNDIFRPYPQYAYCYLLFKNSQVVGLFEEAI